MTSKRRHLTSGPAEFKCPVDLELPTEERVAHFFSGKEPIDVVISWGVMKRDLFIFKGNLYEHGQAENFCIEVSGYYSHEDEVGMLLITDNPVTD